MKDIYVDYKELDSLELAEDKYDALFNFAEALSSEIKNNIELLVCARECINVTGNLTALSSQRYLNDLDIMLDLDDVAYACTHRVKLIDIIKKCFGMSPDYFYRLLCIGNKFVDFGDVAEFTIPELKDLTISKLKELLPLSVEQVRKAFNTKTLTKHSTVKEIREYVKSLKTGQPLAKKVLEEEISGDIPDEEIPYAYDPNKYYDFDYFKSKNKNQLLNIVWELQRHFEKYLKK